MRTRETVEEKGIENEGDMGMIMGLWFMRHSFSQDEGVQPARNTPHRSIAQSTQKT